MSAFDELMAFQRETEALAQVAMRLGWDQETVMPRGSATQRGEEMAAIEGVLHARRTDPRIGALLESAQAPDDSGTANLRLIRHTYDRTTRVPARLASELARTTSLAQGIWAESRAQENVGEFLPTLRTVLDLTREKAAALADGGDLYDALLEDYEPGATGAGLEQMFGALRPRLVALRERVLGAERQPASLSGTYDEAGQMALSAELALAFGYDTGRGRIDKAVHPFSSGSGNDVRITTRTSAIDPFNCFYSTIHEVGHGAYEQGIDQAHLLTPLGQGVSMGVHESQSRIYENQLARSSAFTGHLFKRMRATFGDFGISDAADFHGTVNRVSPGFIRTESDEVQYNLHVLLRFDLERQLIAGTLDVADLEAAWNARFLSDFGIAVDRPSNGVLQDVHWPVGLFGYFPTYTLGNVYAGCLHKALRDAVPDLDDHLARGDTTPATDWLRRNLQTFGGLRPPRDTIRHACGFEPSEVPLLDYLEAKYAAIYHL
ncbi:carboxypeptidase M32 [Oceaniovalibus sp. ACAM 378]|uniref:carboxypeptidase M32 n=1 Tax=Oceaniovalibus sp. ACAM 378 TaxID=2599923 RepID=UPI0011D8CDB0|nr:carboxypeptidase M32 [Oceaniovalibus sp. ACAM 378]TYB89820.1 carboxypeptidase M32 [Oceaniovalibus sp. ACAM 378]